MKTRFCVGIRSCGPLPSPWSDLRRAFRPVASRAFVGNEVGRLVLKVQVRKVRRGPGVLDLCSKKRPQQDSNLRARLRRGFLRSAPTCSDSVTAGITGRPSGTQRRQ